MKQMLAGAPETEPEQQQEQQPQQPQQPQPATAGGAAA